ncbi:hypothetical protein Vretifemale_17738 [Volvox reticuliferus]|nr:hypothetical protein Vretifemale_17738 [Volvox reticuliferus]
MASALHIYANLLWRDGNSEARVKKVAALRLLQEPHYRLHLHDLSDALVSGHGSTVSTGLLAPDQLADVVSTDSCFVFNEGTGNVLIDAASLMAAGKDCLKAQIDRVWDTSSPLSWARNQLAWYIVSRQHIDMRPPDLFLAPVDDAENFLAAAWTARMDFRDHADHPYRSLQQLLGGETRFELTPDQSCIRLNFHKLLLQQPPPPPQQEQTSASHQLLQQLRQHQQSGGASFPGNGHEARVTSESATMDWGQSGSDDGHGGAVYGGREGASVAAAAAALQRVKLSQRSDTYSTAGGHSGNGSNGMGGGNRDLDGEGVDEQYEEVEDYIDVGDDYEDDDGEMTRGSSASRNVGGGGGSGAAAAAGARYANGDEAAGGGGSAAAATLIRPIWPLRPDLLPQYIRAVFAGSGSPHDQLMGVVALALVDAGRGTGPGTNRGWQVPQQGAASPEAHRFRMSLPKLVAHVREVAPHLLPPAPPAPGGGSASHGSSSTWQVGALMQRLCDRHSRGCFRVLVPGSGAAGPAGIGEGHQGGSGGGEEEREEAVALLDLETLRDCVVGALTAAAAAVFSGNRPVDDIRRTAAMHLAARTRPFAGRVHCVRLSTLARALAEQLPPDVFDPTRLSGFERLVGSESSSNVMHVFRKVMPGGLAGLSHGHGEEMGTFVTLNLGKLLAAAGVRELDGVTAARSAREGGGGMGWIGRGASDAAPTAAAVAAAAASRAAAFAAASASVHSARDLHLPPPPPPPSVSTHGGSLPPPPSDAALRRAVEALFLVPDGGRGGGGEYAAAAKRTAALSLVKALHTQQGGFLPLSRLTDIVEGSMTGAPDLEQLLSSEPELFEIQEAWYGGPRSVRLRASAVMARAAALSNAAGSATAATAANGSGHGHAPAGASSEPLPRRPNALNCPYYMRHGTCGFGATCKYNHPPLTPRQPAESSPSAAPVASTGAAAAAGAGPQRPPAVNSYRQQQQQQPPQPPPPPQPPSNSHHSVSAAVQGSSTASTMTPSDGSAAGSGGGGISTAAAGSRLSPTTLEVKVVTVACSPIHVDMLQHCFAAPQVAVACKVRHTAYTLLGNTNGADVCLVQLYAPAVMATAGNAGGGAGATGAAHGSGNDAQGGSATTPGGPPAGSGGGGNGAAGSTLRWPATVYLVDAAAGEDKTGMLLPSLSPLLESEVPKVVYCGSEVRPGVDKSG